MADRMIATAPAPLHETRLATAGLHQEARDPVLWASYPVGPGRCRKVTTGRCGRALGTSAPRARLLLLTASPDRTQPVVGARSQPLGGPGRARALGPFLMRWSRTVPWQGG